MFFHFTKMHGAGNDFVVINTVEQPYQFYSKLVRQWGNRHTGIGFDQLLLIESSQDQYADFFYRIFNSDGSEVSQCGNGAYCLGKFLRDERLTTKSLIRLKTQTSLLKLHIKDNDDVMVNMGRPLLQPAAVPFLIDTDKYATQYSLQIDEKVVVVSVLSMGNPHCVLIVDNIEQFPVKTLGKKISEHSRFPKKTNVNFVQILDRQSIQLRTYERGAAETKACGSGACAAVVAGRLLNLLDEKVQVKQSGGCVSVTWKHASSSVFLTGRGITVFKGEIQIPMLTI